MTLSLFAEYPMVDGDKFTEIRKLTNYKFKNETYDYVQFMYTDKNKIPTWFVTGLIIKEYKTGILLTEWKINKYD